MPSDALATICVRYRYVDGYHVFTSSDVSGLYVASRNSEKAFKQVAPSLEKLMKLNDDIDCTVEYAQSYSEFVRAIQMAAAAVEAGADALPEVHPGAMMMGESCFIVRPAA